MTRTVRARRAERPHQPLYARVLRLRHLAPSGLLCFVFLEGAVVLGILLALAELVSWWGVVVLPVTVALMVKFNDLVAGAFTPPPATGTATSVRASVLRPAAMGQPAFPSDGNGSSAGPAFGSRFDGSGPTVELYATPGSAPAVVRNGHRDRSAIGADGAPTAGEESPAFGYGPALSPDAPAVGYPGSYSRGLSSTTADSRSYDGEVGRSGRPSVERAVEEPRGNNVPIRRAWADQLDVRQQMTRQAASRRYE